MEHKKSGPKTTPLHVRLMRHVQVDPETGCWMWTGSTTVRGYPQIKAEASKSPKFAHRISYELEYGEIPEGLVIDHLCYTDEGISNRLCVNPQHLEAVTQSENTQRGYEAKRKLGLKHPLANREPWNKGKKLDPETGMYN